MNNLVITSLSTVGNGISNYTAQNLGADILWRIKAGFRASVKMVWTLCLPIAVLYVLAGDFLVGAFMDHPSQLAIVSGSRFLLIVAPFYFVISVKLAADGILRGAGFMRPFMIATFTDLILRVILAVVLSEMWGYLGIWFAWPVGWSIAAALSCWFYKKGPWEKIES